ncbi:MAG: glycosyltransferase family 4 protein [bacterium]|nr:glycosyltransferase family 4 protein [bacterium]
MSRKKLRILVPLSKDFFASSDTAYTGAQHFSKLFLNYFDRSQHTIIGIGLKPPPLAVGVSCRVVSRKQGQDWLWLSLLLSTREILNAAAGKPNQETKTIIRRIKEQFIALQPDLFCLNGQSALTLLFALAARDAKIPIVTIHHGIWSIEAEAHPLLAKRTDLIDLRVAAEAELIRISKKNIFLPQHSGRTFEKQVCRVPAVKRVVLPLPYNDIFAKKNPNPPPHPSSRKHIGLIARWDPIKNHEAYLALAREVSRQKLPWTLHAATTPFAAVTALRHLLEPYRAIIRITEHIPPAKLLNFYRRMDAIVVPSHYETFCGVAMEALLQQIPTLVSPGVGMSDALRTCGLERWIISFNSAPAVVKHLQKAFSDAVPKSTREFLLRENASKKIFKQYENIFQTLVV